MRVTVLTIEHKHGVDVFAYRTAHKAQEDLHEFVTDYWDEVEHFAGEMPKKPSEAIQLYFENHDNESYIMETVELKE